jgi:hypothetical protein
MMRGNGLPPLGRSPARTLVLSAGMPRAGSGWYFNLIHDLVVAAGGKDARQIRQRFHLGRILTEVNCNIGTLSLPRLGPAMIPVLLGNAYTIKVHSGPTPAAVFLMRRGWMAATYIYRDPRDALLSAYEFGRRVLQQRGRPNAFSRYSTIELAIEFMVDYLRHWQGWVECPYALVTRYEDLVADYDTQVARLVQFLGLDPRDGKIGAVTEQYRPGQGSVEQKGLHFSQGRLGRFRQGLSAEQQERCSRLMGPYLERMGYPTG